MKRTFESWQAAAWSAARWLRGTRGQDLLEYGLLAALISVFAVGAVTLLGQQIDIVFWQTIAGNF